MGKTWKRRLISHRTETAAATQVIKPQASIKRVARQSEVKAVVPTLEVPTLETPVEIIKVREEEGPQAPEVDLGIITGVVLNSVSEAEAEVVTGPAKTILSSIKKTATRATVSKVRKASRKKRNVITDSE
jgi:hypothetical protein